jgi:N-acetyl-alpha-D-glucosaminyl L-malate synthase BshA
VFARVRKTMPARLMLVGDGPDAPAAARLARQLGVLSDIEFLGEQDSVIPLLSAADVFLLPSDQESFGLAALEAMACGVPVVASNAGGIPEVVEHEVSGFLHDRTALDEMAASVVRLLSDRERWHRMSHAASTAAHTLYCDTSIVPMYEAYYQHLLDKPLVAG